VSVRSADSGRPPARFALLFLYLQISLRKLHIHTVNVGLRELALFLRARRAFRAAHFSSNPALGHHLFQVTQAQRIRHIPAHALQITSSG
jgi:hypothetical protein